MLELLEVACDDGSRDSPAGHGEDAGEVDGFGVGHDCRDRVVGRQLAGEGDFAAQRTDQGDATVPVEAVPCSEGGDVGCLGDRVDGFLAAVTAGQAVVAPLGLEDLGQPTDVVLAGLAGVGG